jgi:hypothetical protein
MLSISLRRTLLTCLAGNALVKGQNVTTTGAQSFSPTPVSTAVASATASPGTPVPGQGSYPALQGGLASTHAVQRYCCEARS